MVLVFCLARSGSDSSPLLICSPVLPPLPSCTLARLMEVGGLSRAGREVGPNVHHCPAPPRTEREPSTGLEIRPLVRLYRRSSPSPSHPPSTRPAPRPAPPAPPRPAVEPQPAGPSKERRFSHAEQRRPSIKAANRDHVVVVSWFRLIRPHRALSDLWLPSSLPARRSTPRPGRLCCAGAAPPPGWTGWTPQHSWAAAARPTAVSGHTRSFGRNLLVDENTYHFIKRHTFFLFAQPIPNPTLGVPYFHCDHPTFQILFKDILTSSTPPCKSLCEDIPRGHSA